MPPPPGPSPAAEPTVDLKALEAEVVAAARRWEDGVFERLIRTAGEDAANDARREFVLPFPAAYTEDTGPDQAVADFVAAKSIAADKPSTLSRQWFTWRDSAPPAIAIAL